MEKQKLNTEMLISALAQIEKQISKNAYMKKKFANASECFGSKGYHSEMIKFMGYRTAIHAILRPHYSVDEIKKQVVLLEGKKIASIKAVDDVMKIINSKDYEFDV